MHAAHVMQYFYQIEPYHSSSSCGLFSMHFDGTIILLYFIEMLPRTVSHGNILLNVDEHKAIVEHSVQQRIVVTHLLI